MLAKLLCTVDPERMTGGHGQTQITELLWWVAPILAFVLVSYRTQR